MTTALDSLQARIGAAADAHGIPRDLVAAQVLVESGGAVDAVGDSGHSRGLMQIDDVYHAYDHARMLTDAAYALDYGCTLLAGYRAQYGSWDTALVAYNGDWANTTHYLARVMAARGQFAAWLDTSGEAGGADGESGESGISFQITGVTGATVAAEAMRRLGDVRETDAENGDHAVSGYCWAFVQDVLRACGLAVAHYGSARQAGDAVADRLQPRGAAAEAGSIGFWRGAGWSADDHVGICLGDGRVVSALASVTITAGWEANVGFRGWLRWSGVADAAGVGVGASAGVLHYAAGNPFGRVPLAGPFWARWDALAAQNLALPLLGWPTAAERLLPDGRRAQLFERGRLVTQPGALAPWDVVQPLLTDSAAD